jgi:hypothetical protein
LFKILNHHRPCGFDHEENDDDDEHSNAGQPCEA